MAAIVFSPRRHQRASSLYVLLLFSILVVGAFGDFRARCSSLVTAKMDPIVFPGEKSGHLHSIVGSLGFDVFTRPHDMRKNDSSCSIIGDFSSYWAPPLFYLDPLTTEPAIIPDFFSAYYLTGRDVDSGMITKVAEFPSNISMLSYQATWVCLTMMGPVVYGASLPDDGSCERLRVMYHFPNCWNGEEYDPAGMHVKYADGVGNVDLGTCPSSHPIHIFQLRLEQNFLLPPELQKWVGPAPFMLSSGNLSTSHADATLVWSVDVLADIQQRCGAMTAVGCDQVVEQIGHSRPKDLREEIAANFTVDPYYREGDVIVSLPGTTWAPTGAPILMPDSPM